MPAPFCALVVLSVSRVRGCNVVRREPRASSLTTATVPWHQEVVSFPGYGIACEHVHCLLLAHTECFLFPGPGGWWIWIDYDRCQVLVRVYEESGGGGLEGVLSALDYMARTPPLSRA
ncbi:unnamed protein product [Arctogadus glacialis]